MNLFLKWVGFALVLMFVAWIIPGISVENFIAAMVACVVIALINIFIKPLLEMISLPINFLTLGLFSLVINALLLMFAGYVTPGFQVEGFLSALLGSIILSIFAGAIAKV